MKRFASAVVFIAVVSLAAAPVTDTESLLRDGNAAFRRGDYATAADLYERAGLRTTEPALVAFNFAAAKYRAALESEDGRAKNLEEARQYFLCCIAKDDPRRARALHFLGACLLQQALDGDGGRAAEAVTRLEDALKEPGLDDESVDDARHNLALARLVLAQTPPPPPDSARPPEKPPGDDTQPSKPRPRERSRPLDIGMHPNGDRTRGRFDPRTSTGDVKTDASRTGNDSRDRQAGGDNTERGPEGAPIDPADVRYLKDAYERILEERQAHKRNKALPPAPGVKDW
jgi:tetratricopeptide (TPR) repeat protein